MNFAKNAPAIALGADDVIPRDHCPVCETVKSLEGEATVIMIAHRLSTIEHADAIYRIGERVEQIALADVDDR